MSAENVSAHVPVQVKLFWDGEARGPLTTSALAKSETVLGSYLLPRSLTVDLALRVFSVDKLPIERVDVSSTIIVENISRSAKLDELGIDAGGCLLIVVVAVESE
jgi:hypothetical protein